MTTKLWREFTRLRDCLQSIADAKMEDPKEPDDADWRAHALECQRCAKTALAASTLSSQDHHTTQGE